ncbi:MAG: APC family permease [Gammaproteobacteria bacterium]|nr:APC family permease [Gammaproteobacteria bacterium]
MSQVKSQHNFGFFSLVMMAVISVASLRNLPIAAQYGFSLISFYVFAGIGFFIPLAWVTAKLAADYPKSGGSYVWIREAFGHGYGHFAVGVMWVYNIIWYPTIFAFITATLAAVIAPGLEHSKWFILTSSLVMFWLLSALHSRGLRISSWINIVSALIGTLFPMLVMITLAAYWLLSGKAAATPMHWMTLLPSWHDFKNISFFSNILFSVLGLEVVAVYAGNVRNASRIYPRALAVSAALILITMICCSLALCVIMPVEKIKLVTGLVDMLQLFFAAYGLNHMTKVIGICIVIGGLGIASSWMIGLANNLHLSLSSINAPAWMQKLNKNHVPSGIMWFQAGVYSVLLLSFVLLPSMNQSYWILSAATAQFAMIYYMILFGAAMKLLRKKKKQRVLAMALPSLGVVLCVLGLIAGFVPPAATL